MLPDAHRGARWRPGGTTMVVSNSSMISGPRRGDGGQRRARHDLGVDGGCAAREGDLARAGLAGAPARGLDRMLPKSSRRSRRPRPTTRSFTSSIGLSSRVAVGLEVFGDEARRAISPRSSPS